MRQTLPIWALLLGLLSATTTATEFIVSPANPGDTVYFRSSATLEFIEGKTTDLTGWIDWDPENPTGPASGVLRVDLRTLRTGIETRDGHMRDNHLHTDAFPYAYFELQSVSGLPPAVVVNEQYSAVTTGFFYIHGRKREMTADIAFELDQTGQELSVKVEFAMKLDEYEIKRPKALFMKLAETIEIEVVYTARAGPGRDQVELPDWPELK